MSLSVLIFVQSADVYTVVLYSICSRSLVAFGSVVVDVGLVALWCSVPHRLDGRYWYGLMLALFVQSVCRGRYGLCSGSGVNASSDCISQIR